jgi:hypothetical protein
MAPALRMTRSIKEKLPIFFVFFTISYVLLLLSSWFRVVVLCDEYP